MATPLALHTLTATPEQSLADSDLDSARIRALSNLLQHRLGCALFGFDVLHNADSDAYYVVWIGACQGNHQHLNIFFT